MRSAGNVLRAHNRHRGWLTRDGRRLIGGCGRDRCDGSSEKNDEARIVGDGADGQPTKSIGGNSAQAREHPARMHDASIGRCVRQGESGWMEAAEARPAMLTSRRLLALRCPATAATPLSVTCALLTRTPWDRRLCVTASRRLCPCLDVTQFAFSASHEHIGRMRNGLQGIPRVCGRRRPTRARIDVSYRMNCCAPRLLAWSGPTPLKPANSPVADSTATANRRRPFPPRAFRSRDSLSVR